MYRVEAKTIHRQQTAQAFRQRNIVVNHQYMRE
jgi:hypothetical protein